MNIAIPKNKNIAENIWFTDIACVAFDATNPTTPDPAPNANNPAMNKHKKVSANIIFLFIILFVY